MNLMEVVLNDYKLDFYSKLFNWSNEHRKEFIEALLIEIGKFSEKGLDHFWSEKDKEYILEGWISALEIFTPATLIKIVKLIQAGKYLKGNDNIPRSSMDFKHFILNGVHSEIPDEVNLNSKLSKGEVLALTYDKSVRRKKSEEAAADNLPKIRAILKRAMSKNKLDLDFEVKNDEELKEIYRKNREAPLIFCEKHGMYDYKDRGCCKCRTE